MAYDLFNLRRFQKGSDDAVPMNASHPPDSQSTRRASSGSRFPAGLTGLLGGNFSSPNPPSNGATSLSVHMGASRVLTGIAILATLILGLWLLLPGGALRAQDAAIEYAENGTDPVATYTAVDPEGVAIKWSLSGADAADFTIAGGVLAFVKSPDFEKPDGVVMGTSPALANTTYTM